MPQGQITRSQAKKLQQNLIIYLQDFMKMASGELNGCQSFETSAIQIQYNLLQLKVEIPSYRG